MNDFYTFAGIHPWLTFFLAWLFISGCIEYPLKIINRLIRHRNIVARGWPPAHLDADGDWKKEESQ